MNACDAQAKPPPAPTPTLRRLRLFVQHNIHGLDAHLATRRSGDQCTRGPLQTPSDGATPRRTRTQSVLGEGFLSRSKSPSNRPKSFEIAAHCGGCMRRSGASDGGTKGALASLRKRPSARSMSLIRSCRLFFFDLISHAVTEDRGRRHGNNSGAVVSRPAGTVGFEGHATSRESQLAPSTCVRRTSAQAVRCSHQPRAGCGAAAEVGAAIRSLRDSRSEEPSDSSELYAGGWQLLEWIGDEYPAHAVARGRASDKRGWAARPLLLQRASGTAPLRGGAACHGAASRRHILKAAVHSPAPRSGACRTPPRFEPQVWSVGAPRPTFARCRRYQGVLTGLGACRVLGSPVARQAASHTAPSFSVTLSIHASPSLIESVV